MYDHYYHIHGGLVDLDEQGQEGLPEGVEVRGVLLEESAILFFFGGGRGRYILPISYMLYYIILYHIISYYIMLYYII